MSKVNLSSRCPYHRLLGKISQQVRRIIELHSPSHLRKVLGKIPTRCPIARLVFWGVVLFGNLQAAVLSGVVGDATNKTPLEGAHIVIKGLKKGSVSQRDGTFTLKDIPPGEWEVECSYIGYYTHREKLRFNNDSEIKAVQFLLYPQSLKLSEVVTTATRTRKLLKDVPVVTEVFPREEFMRRGAVTVSDALSTELGFQIQEDFSGQGITLQGADPDKVLILIDGNRVIGRIKGSLDLDQISVANVKQIEVVKGAVSTMYGSEAIGGVINVITKDPRPGLYIFGETKAGYSLPDRQPPKIGLRGTHWSPGVRVGYGGQDWGVEGGLRYQHQPLQDLDPSTPHTEGPEEADRFSGDAKFIWELSPKWRINSSIRWMEEEKNWVEDAGLVSISVSYDDKEKNRRSDKVIELIHSPGTSNNYSLKFYLTDNFHLWEKWTQRKWGQPIVKDYSRANEDYWEVSLTGGHKLSETHYLNWGGEFYRWKINSDARLGEISSPFSGDLTATGIFIQDEMNLDERWSLLPGVRWEKHEVYGDNLSPRLSLMWKPSNRWNLRAALGSGYRAPSSKELYFTFNHQAAGYVVYGNPHLKPERSTNFNLVLQYTYQDASFSRITLYHNKMKDLIDFQSVGVNDEYYTGVFQYQNIHSAGIRGLELERVWLPYKGWEIRLGYGFMDTRNYQTGGPLLRRPKHTIIWDLTWIPQSSHLKSPKHPNLIVKIWGRAVSRAMFVDIFQTDVQASDEWTIPYQIWNIAITRQFSSQTQLILQTDNLFNAIHSRYGPRQGRTVSLTLRWSLRE